MHRTNYLLLAILVSLTITSCKNKKSGGAEEAEDPGTLQIEATTDAVYIDEVIRIRANLIFLDDSVKDVTGVVDWKITPDTLTVTEGPGIYKGVSAGAAVVIATLGEQSGEIAIDIKALTEGLEGLSIEPATGEIPKDYSIPATATGLYADGQARDVTTLCEWESLTPEILTVNVTQSTVRLQGVTTGEGKVKASLSGFDTEATFDVTLSGLEELQVVPMDYAMPVGLSHQLTAIGKFQKGEVIDLTEMVNWASSDAAVLRANNDPGTKGMVDALTEGSATITASEAGGISADATVTVTPAQVDALSVFPAVVSVPTGGTRSVNASAVLAGGIALDVTDVATWEITDTNVAILRTLEDGDLLIEGVSPGNTQLTVSYGTATTVVDIEVREAELVDLNILSFIESLPIGTSTQFVVLGIYSDNTITNVSALATWTSSAPEIAFVSGFPDPGAVTGNSTGTATITAEAGGISISQNVIVTDAVIVGVQVRPPIAAIPVGDPLDYLALGVLSDNSVRNMTEDAAWTSSNLEVAVISNATGQRGLATTLSPGETVITVTLGEFSDTAELKVRDMAIQFLVPVPSDITIMPGQTEQMRAIAIYDNGSTLLVTEQAAWTSLNPDILQVSNADGDEGKITGISAGVGTIHIQVGESTGSREVTVIDANLVSIDVNPPEVTVPPGFSVQVQAIGTFDFNDYQDGVTGSSVWSSADESIAIAMNPPLNAGRIMGVVPGQTTVTVAKEEITQTVAVTVDDRVLASLEVGPHEAIIPTDQIQEYVAIATFDNGSTMDVTQDVNFETSDSTVITEINHQVFPGMFSTVGEGTAVITATKGEISGSTTVTIRDADPVMVVIAPVSPIVNQGQMTTFSATAIYDDDTTSNMTSLCTWSSSDTPPLLVLDEMFVKGWAMPIAPGTATITAECPGDFIATTNVTIQ